MAVDVHIPLGLRKYCHGRTELPVEAGSVRQALDELEQSYPLLYNGICDETGAVRPHINLFVNQSLVRDREASALNRPLEPGDVLTVLPAVSGG